MSEISLKIGKIFLTFLEMADLENVHFFDIVFSLISFGETEFSEIVIFEMILGEMNFPVYR